MKQIYCVLLFLLVKLIAGQHQDEQIPGDTFVYGRITKTINNAIANAQKAKYELITKANYLIDNYVKKNYNSLANSYVNIEEIAEQLESDISHKNEPREKEDIPSCWKHYQPELKQAINDSKSEARQCVVTAKNDIIYIREEIRKYTDAVEVEIQNLLAIYKKCVKPLRPIYTVACVTKNVGNINKSVLKIVKNGNRAIKRATLRLIQITDIAQECLEISVVHAQERISLVGDKIWDCILNGLKTTTAAPPTTESSPATTQEPTTTAAPPTTESSPATTQEPTTTAAPPTTESSPATTQQPTTTAAPPTTESSPATTQQPTTTDAQPTTESSPATTQEPTTTSAPPTTESSPATTQEPTTTAAPPTTESSPATTQEPTTTAAPPTTESSPATTQEPTTTAAPPTTESSPATTQEPTTTAAPPTTESSPATTQQTTTQQ